ncbi:MAG: MMPL family transporter [Actinobacteria bacterium]|nr:MMPL family transporter [Actinomycetota bacterium]
MFNTIAHLVVRRRKATLILFILVVLVAGGIGSLAFSKLDSGGYSDPNSQSAKAAKFLSSNFNVKDPSIVLVIDSGTLDVSDPSVAASATRLEKAVKAEPGVAQTLSFWSAGNAPTLKSSDGKAGFLFIYTTKTDSANQDEIGKIIQSKFDGKFESLTVYASGRDVIQYAVNTKISKDLALAEAISIPLTFILLAFVFGALAASTMPLVVGISAILGAFFLIFLFTLFTSVSIFALNLITGLGLGLGIDYALLIVNRFREELHSGKSVEESVISTVLTAGKTVFYSGLTVLVTLSSLIFFPLNYLKSFGYAGISVITLAVAGALIPLPAILAIIGGKVDKGVVRKSALVPKEDGGWAATARMVMRRPIPVVMISLVILAIFAAPIKDIAFGDVDARVLPKSDKAAIASQMIVDRFSGQEGSPIEIIIPGAAGAAQKTEEVAAYVMAVSAVEGVVRVTPPQSNGVDLRFTAIPSMGSRTTQAQTLIHNIQTIAAPDGTLIGGPAADFTDSQDGIARTLPWALGWIALSVLILIFIFTGSIILPIKAVLLNALSLGATLGVLSWIFIDGHLKWLIGDFTITGSLDTGITILIAVVVFGLSMDYEIFLLSRIREEHFAGKSNMESVATGLQRSARIITAAAMLLAVVFGAFITSGVTLIKMMGFGVAFAVLLDATLIRALLVPALMRLFGELNWWAPKALKRFTLTH